MEKTVEYQHEFNVLKTKSFFLSDDPKNISIQNPGAGWRNETQKQLEGRIKEYKEKVIPGIEKQISQVKEDFREFCKAQVLEGKKEPSQMPEIWRDRLSILEAHLDIAKLESEAIEKHIEAMAKRQEIKSHEKMFKNGHRNQGPLRNGIKQSSDGQSCSLDSDFIPRISDKRSRFYGMKVSDYDEFICQPWLAEFNRRSHLNFKRRKELYEAGHPIAPSLFNDPRPPLVKKWPEGLEKPKDIKWLGPEKTKAMRQVHA